MGVRTSRPADMTEPYITGSLILHHLCESGATLCSAAALKCECWTKRNLTSVFFSCLPASHYLGHSEGTN